jgi:hypothetical protein
MTAPCAALTRWPGFVVLALYITYRIVSFVV